MCQHSGEDFRGQSDIVNFGTQGSSLDSATKIWLSLTYLKYNWKEESRRNLRGRGRRRAEDCEWHRRGPRYLRYRQKKWFPWRELKRSPREVCRNQKKCPHGRRIDREKTKLMVSNTVSVHFWLMALGDTLSEEWWGVRPVCNELRSMVHGMDIPSENDNCEMEKRNRWGWVCCVLIMRGETGWYLLFWWENT